MPEQTPALTVRVNAPIGALQLHATFTLTAPWTVLFGPSGSGKSSLLRLISGLWTPPGASIHIGTEDMTSLPPHRRRIALVAQQVALFPHLTVHQNIAFGHRPRNTALIAELIQAFDLSRLSSASPATLSGGERQRVAIARALASSPRYLLLDEVFTGMHTPQRQALLETLRTYSQRLQLPILSVTHDVPEALQADQVLTLNNGHMLAQGIPATILQAERDALRHQLDPKTAQP